MTTTTTTTAPEHAPIGTAAPDHPRPAGTVPLRPDRCLRTGPRARLPRPVALSSSAHRWWEDEVLDWLEGHRLQRAPAVAGDRATDRQASPAPRSAARHAPPTRGGSMSHPASRGGHSAGSSVRPTPPGPTTAARPGGLRGAGPRDAPAAPEATTGSRGPDPTARAPRPAADASSPAVGQGPRTRGRPPARRHPPQREPVTEGIDYWLDPHRPTPRGGWGESHRHNMTAYARVYFRPPSAGCAAWTCAAPTSSSVNAAPDRLRGAQHPPRRGFPVGALRQGDYLLDNQVIDLSNVFWHGIDPTQGGAKSDSGELAEFVQVWKRPLHRASGSVTGRCGADRAPRPGPVVARAHGRDRRLRGSPLV